MDRENIWYLLGLAAFAALAIYTWQVGQQQAPAFASQTEHAHGPHGADEHVEEGLLPHGPHGGLLFEDRDLAIELLVHEHHEQRWIYAYLFTDRARALAPQQVQLSMTFHHNGLEAVIQLRPDSSEGKALAGELPEDAMKGWQLTMLARHEQHAHEWNVPGYFK